MSNKIVTLEIDLEPSDNRRLASLCGPFDDNIKHLERRLGVEISCRGNFFTIVGKPHTSAAALEILKTLYVNTAPVRNNIPDIEPDEIHLAIKETGILDQDLESNIEHGKEVIIGIRPEYIELEPAEDSSPISVNIELVETLGSEALLHCHFLGKSFVVKAETHGRVEHLHNIDTLHFRKTAITVFDKQTRKALPVSTSH